MKKENFNTAKFFIGTAVYHVGIFYGISKMPYRYQQSSSLAVTSLSLGLYYMYVFKNRKDSSFSPFKF
jgi:hypothetical protein